MRTNGILSDYRESLQINRGVVITRNHILYNQMPKVHVQGCSGHRNFDPHHTRSCRCPACVGADVVAHHDAPIRARNQNTVVLPRDNVPVARRARARRAVEPNRVVVAGSYPDTDRTVAAGGAVRGQPDKVAADLIITL